MNTSKSFLKITAIIEASAAKGMALSQALPEILGVNVGRSDGYLNYKNISGNEIDAYSNPSYALQLALKAKVESVDADDEPTLSELLEEDSGFSVIIARKNGRTFYDMHCDGINCSLSSILDGMDWYEQEWIEG